MSVSENGDGNTTRRKDPSLKELLRAIPGALEREAGPHVATLVEDVQAWAEKTSDHLVVRLPNMFGSEFKSTLKDAFDLLMELGNNPEKAIEEAKRRAEAHEQKANNMMEASGEAIKTYNQEIAEAKRLRAAAQILEEFGLKKKGSKPA